MVSRMEMGENLQHFTQEKNADVLDMEKVDKSQKNIKCDEVSIDQSQENARQVLLQPEQLQYLKLKGLQEFEKFDNVLGPGNLLIHSGYDLKQSFFSFERRIRFIPPKHVTCYIL